MGMSISGVLLRSRLIRCSETNLKIKQASPSTASMTDPQSISRLTGHLLSEYPNSSLYTYDGTLHLDSGAGVTKVPLGPTQMLLRGAQLRNTDWVYGIVVAAGHETKLMKNATYAPVDIAETALTLLAVRHRSKGLLLSAESILRSCFSSSCSLYFL
jgi:magnesium-transporting ATPase (P-type)